MSGQGHGKLAYAGAEPSHIPLRNTFHFIFDQPFKSQNDWTPASQVVPRIEEDRKIFVEDKSGKSTAIAAVWPLSEGEYRTQMNT